MIFDAKIDEIKFKLDEGAYEPVRAHVDDGGIDIRAKGYQIVPAKDSAVFNTGVHVELPKGTCGLLVSKSGLNVKRGLNSTGLIDEGFTGEIIVRLYNGSDQDYEVLPGDKITQIVVLPVFRPAVKIVNDISGGERGDNGYGSSGR